MKKHYLETLSANYVSIRKCLEIIQSIALASFVLVSRGKELIQCSIILLKSSKSQQ